MRVQVLASGSRGNAVLVRAGETHVLVDAGLPLDDLLARLQAARVPPWRLDHIVLTHGHLDHARCAGALARRARARVHCAERMMRNASVRRAPRLATLPIGGSLELASDAGRDALRVTTVKIPHDAEPTVALRLEAQERAAVLVTDMGHPVPEVARRLGSAHLLLLEFNHDAERLRAGPYPPALKRRIGGPLGHLSNDEAAEMLARLAGPHLHTLVLTHLSETNNTPDLALLVSRRTLARLGRNDVRTLVADPFRIGPNLQV